jgi:hypothetical protein
MSSCAACGHQIGVGRYCTNCGAPVDPVATDGTPVSSPVPAGDWRTDTAERALPVPAVDPRTPPAAVAPPPPPRYPLFADEVNSWASPDPLGEEPPPAVDYVDQAPYLGPRQDQDGDYAEDGYDYAEEDDGRRSALPWVLAALAVLAVVAAGWWYLARDGGAGSGAGRDDPSAESSTAQPEGVEVAGRASAKAPSTSPPNQDVDGDQVSYDASNMLDGVAETAWRTAGDGSGIELVLKLREPTELTRVGLVNGYAKTSTDAKGRTFDWYLGNRRVIGVVWVLDDTHKVRQQLTETRDLQTLDIDPVTTSRVVLRLVKVSPPGDGTAARDFTAISEVSLLGVPAA